MSDKSIGALRDSIVSLSVAGAIAAVAFFGFAALTKGCEESHRTRRELATHGLQEISVSGGRQVVPITGQQSSPN